MKFVRITRENLARWQGELEALEMRASYPLGSDTFRISHGKDYFAFFERLGDVRYYAWENDGQLVAVGCGVLRKNPARWYLADVKVRADFRGQHLPIAMLKRAFFQNWLRCGKGYAVAMNPADGSEPKSARLLQHFGWIPPSLISSFQLHIYSADVDKMRSVLPLVTQQSGLGRPHFVSLKGVKDLIFESTKQPLSLLHAKFGDSVDERTFREPQKGSTHMWCCPAQSPLAAALSQVGEAPSATATVLQHRLGGFDWRRLDTSEI
jgi:hypothetical protein